MSGLFSIQMLYHRAYLAKQPRSAVPVVPLSLKRRNATLLMIFPLVSVIIHFCRSVLVNSSDKILYPWTQSLTKLPSALGTTLRLIRLSIIFPTSDIWCELRDSTTCFLSLAAPVGPLSSFQFCQSIIGPLRRPPPLPVEDWTCLMGHCW